MSFCGIFPQKTQGCCRNGNEKDVVTNQERYQNQKYRDSFFHPDLPVRSFPCRVKQEDARRARDARRRRPLKRRYMLGSQGRHQEQCRRRIYNFPENPFFRYQTAVQAEGKGQQHYANHGQSVPVQPREALIETAYHQAQQIFDMQKMGVRRAGNDARRHIPHGHIIVDVIDKGNGFVYKEKPAACQ